MLMFETEPMQKLRIIFLAEDKPRVIKALHKFGYLDFRKSKLSLVDDSPLAYATQLYELLVRVEGALAILPKPKKIEGRFEHLPAEKLVKVLGKEKVVQEIYDIANRLSMLEESKQELEEALYIASGFSCTSINLSRLRSTKASIACYAGEAKKLEPLLASLHGTRGVALQECSNGKEVFFAIASDKSEEAEKALSSLYSAIRQGAAKELNLDNKYLQEDMQARQLARKLKQALEENEEERSMLKAKLEKIAKGHYAKLAAYAEMLHIELDRANASSNFKKTEKTSIIEGWVPKKKLDKLEEMLKKETKGKIAMEPIASDELAPTLLNRPKLLKPFDFAMVFFSPPRSDEIDPTWVFIFAFLIFYGFMVSDVGYGILSLILATWVTKVTNPEGMTYNAAKVWQLGTIPAILFGILTNQYFGLQLDQYFLPFRGIDWVKNVTSFMLASILLGIAELIIGLSFGFVNKYRHGEKLKAYSKLTSIGAIVLGALFTYGAFFGGFEKGINMLTGISTLVLFVATIVLGGSEGSEAMSLLTHTLSYTRLMGFGLTSVMIAYLIDLAFTPTLAHGILVFVLLVIAFLVLHTLNMIVSIFEGIVQGVRLNIVEFFTKFYTGGGIVFKPFAYKRMLTKEEKVVK